MYATSLQGGLEVLNAGVTTIAEYCHNVRSPDHAEEGIRGVRDAGVRAVWSFSFTGLGKGQSSFETTVDRLRFLERLATSHFASHDALVTLGVCPEEPSWWGPQVDGVRTQVRSRARATGADVHARE
jgi:cytosine/adenosine deaminase-related metal-dependent hydrolase